ncbi:PQQ-dependent catabolism-associated CXXCW motif protein [Pseudomonas arsenicoxydans]|uniref:PQQ-dependent catabolism-associated CXXCW motif protein n=1 Tax=Pseudomonas arsenicoxydans TaxID=702115 RepID=A0A502HHQ8_9PSED|nr:PQQ-dependent catabolism-associated CXXCW motif protein [Pseudomonas arsenicoxydans]TPG74181.1 PQQ-dependent catabolism-associated CXXCW motif protein [Pseudomonas arsenicoxydans]
MPRARRCLLRPSFAALPLCLVLSAAHAESPLFSADGYRINLYRSPTPDSLQGATIVDTPALQTLLSQTPPPLLIDVYRRQWLQGQFIEDQPHENLPGSHWLANTGDGDLTPDWQGYFARNLKALTAGDPARPLVFYCRADCWLSWNAVKRASAMGYKTLYWYRDGLDAWQSAGLAVTPARPEPFP